ncbi:helix-turn-helix domain-containing protein [Paenibacillus paeoniae]|uniref:Helix-turn-helix domain-containing protein n=1 Tax=Paenibacillus paeoniae TaxID=2292705 RepID=A0A371PGU4_9BACL|nr:helix-turn-helix domain-containing protein [Paenibacillus paeoniae]REK75171.1 helix-turn-helix domain-containing protein [Paenibacillus paeoniae]
MLNVGEPQLNAGQWIAQWESTAPLTGKWMTVGAIHHMPSPTLVLITDGQAIWNINGQHVHVAPGHLIAMERDLVIEVVEGGDLDLAGWQIQFHTYTLFHKEGGGQSFEWRVPDGNMVMKIGLTGGFLSSISDRLNEEWLEDSSGRMVENQHFLYGLLNQLYQKQPSEQQTIEKGMMRSIAYMQEHYDRVITRKQLAQIAGISQWHYSRKFNERYGKPPLDYLANYRIYRAQEELLLTSARTQEIAKKAGFEDAPYFSRRFKQLAGVSPRNYARTLSERRLISLSPLCAEVLIGLGVIPHAVVVTPLLLADHQRQLFHEHRIKLLEVPQYVIHFECMEQEQPELIIGHFVTEAMKKKLRTIAPVITGLSRDIEVLLNQLATLFNKEEQAAMLQAQVGHELDTARDQLKALADSSATVMVLRVEPFGYRYLGGNSSGMSQLLYKKLNLSLPVPLQTGEAWFNPCPIELLERANPDYLFIEKRVMEHFNSDDYMDKLLESHHWKKLKAVHHDRVFYMDTRLWVDGCGVIGHTKMLGQVISSLLGRQNE